MKAFATVARKPKSDECTGLLAEFVIPGMGGELDYTAAVVIVGPFYSLKEFIKDGVRFEQEINHVTIPVPRNAEPAKFLSSEWLNERIRVMDREIHGMALFFEKYIEVS